MAHRLQCLGAQFKCSSMGCPRSWLQRNKWPLWKTLIPDGFLHALTTSYMAWSREEGKNVACIQTTRKDLDSGRQSKECKSMRPEMRQSGFSCSKLFTKCPHGSVAMVVKETQAVKSQGQDVSSSCPWGLLRRMRRGESKALPQKGCCSCLPQELQTHVPPFRGGKGPSQWQSMLSPGRRGCLWHLWVASEELLVLHGLCFLCLV